MAEYHLGQLALLILIGVGCQVVAHLARLPSILILLIVGLLLGPFTGLFSPAQTFGDLLTPLVSLAVAIILFEGGLSLRLKEIPHVGRVLPRLIVLGVPLTTIAVGYLCHYILGLSWGVSLLVGAIASVSGPTVVTPLIRHIRPKAPLGAILRWEGIVVDPVGVALAVLIFEGTLQRDLSTVSILTGTLSTLLIGAFFGALAGAIVVAILNRHALPDHLQAPLTIAVLVAGYAVSNHFARESGLLMSTLMGAVIVNRTRVAIGHLNELSEVLRDLCIGMLFITLSANLQFEQLSGIGWDSLVLLILIIFAVRPLMVFAVTVGSSLSWRQRAFISAVAPRGIVAASMASLLSLSLIDAGVPGGEQLAPLIFLIILGTVGFYGISAGRFAKLLGVKEDEPQGILFIGAHRAARLLAAALRDLGVRTLLIDTNHANVNAARREGIDAYAGSAVAEQTFEQIDLAGIGKLLALTSNDEANSLAVVEFAEVFGRSELYQIAPEVKDQSASKHESNVRPRGRVAFGASLAYEELARRMRGKNPVRLKFKATEDDLAEVKKEIEAGAIPLFSLDSKGRVTVITDSASASFKAGHTILYLAPIG